MRRGAALALVLAVVLATPLGAHNNASVHPEITDVAIELVRRLDRMAAEESDPNDLNGTCDDCAYAELWENSRNGLRDIGGDPENADPYVDAFLAGEASTMLGVVIEDGTGGVTIARVVSHFYHARTGAGLFWVNTPSRVRSQRHFDFGVRLFDYTPESQERAYIYLGRFLHHVQDMSSPAHVHDDPHIPDIPWEKDDYEGKYVPFELWPGGELRNLLDDQSAALEINSAGQIWPPAPTAGELPDDAALAGFVFNRSIYQATLEFPPCCSLFSPTPTGELALMFPDESDDFFNDGLHWEPGSMFSEPAWEIDGVGAYYYQLDWEVDEQSWWGEFDPGSGDGESAYYYIEDLTEDFGGEKVVPSRHRTTYEALYDETTNPMELNNKCVGGSNPDTLCFDDGDCEGGGSCAFGKTMLKRQSDSLLRPAVAYTAGAAKWWFSVANLPPYLQEVTATQSGATRYHGEWDDVVIQETITYTEFGPATEEQVPTVLRRIFDHQPWERRYINEASPVTIELRFNEPIKEVTTFALLDDDGSLIWDLLPAIASQATDATPQVSPESDVWTFTILPETIDAAPAGLDGDRILHVRAIDRNAHQQIDGEPIGAELDGNPETPAKRDRNRTGFNSGAYVWHSTDENIPGNDERFAYDYEDGDRNHRLLFDTEGPNTTVTIDQN